MSGTLGSATGLPQFIYDLLASQPSRGGGLHNWLYRSARVLHPYRTPEEIIEFLRAGTYGEPIKPKEIEDAVKTAQPLHGNAAKRHTVYSMAENKRKSTRRYNRIGCRIG